MRKYLAVMSVLALSAAACTKSAPLSPSTAGGAPVSTADAKAGVTVTTPALVSPAANAQIAFAQQPITLTIKNAVATGSSALTYTFQVATDSGFTKIAYSKEAIVEGSG